MLVLFDSIVTCTIVTKFVNYYYYVTRKRWMWTARASLSMCGGTRAHQSFSSSLDVVSLLTFAEGCTERKKRDRVCDTAV